MVSMRKIQTVDDYIRSEPRKNVRTFLEKLRQTIKKAAPGAEEKISYRMPAFKWKGKPLAYYAAFTHHIGLFPPAPKAFAKEIVPYAGPRGNLKFFFDQPLPLDLVKRIVKHRVKEYDAALKKK